MTINYKLDLVRKMVRTFSTEELENLAFYLGIEWGELPGKINSKKVAAMISHQMQKGELKALIDLLEEERPNEDWPDDIPGPEKQIEDEKADLSEAERKAIFDNLLNKVGPLTNAVMQIKAQVESDLKYLDSPQTGILVRLLAGANLIGHINLEGVSLRKEDLTRANLDFAHLSLADLSEANLIGADLSRANLQEADLQKADLRRADLREANLSRAKLIGANLYGARLYGASLTKADLQEANLQKADIRVAKLGGANLSEANLGRSALVRANLYGAKYTTDTTWPDDFNPKAAGAILVDDEGNPIKDSDEE